MFLQILQCFEDRRIYNSTGYNSPVHKDLTVSVCMMPENGFNENTLITDSEGKPVTTSGMTMKKFDRKALFQILGGSGQPYMKNIALNGIVGALFEFFRQIASIHAQLGGKIGNGNGMHIACLHMIHDPFDAVAGDDVLLGLEELGIQEEKLGSKPVL